MRHRWDFHGKTLRIADVPMEYIEFGRTHAVDGSLDCRNRYEIPSCIQQYATVSVNWTIFDACWFNQQHASLTNIRRHQMLQRFQAMSNAKYSWSNNSDRHLITCGTRENGKTENISAKIKIIRCVAVLRWWELLEKVKKTSKFWVNFDDFPLFSD